LILGLFKKKWFDGYDVSKIYYFKQFCNEILQKGVKSGIEYIRHSMDTNKIAPSILKTKQHFEILDGLRGIAALAIVMFHFTEWVYTDYSQNFIGHGFLAVDFFFCLSGFVIGYAYDDRIAKMGVSEFFKSRLIRLHPLVISGSVLGLLAFLFDPFGGHPELYSTGKIILAFICSLMLIPEPAIADRSFNLFSFNAPAWSLFWEYIANIVYAWVLCRMRRAYLILLVLISAVALCFVCYRSGNLLGGWSGPTFWDGSARVSYSFMAGLLVYRSGWVVKNKLGFIGLAFLLFLAFVMPYSTWNWLSEPLVVLFYFPFLIALGAGASLTAGLKKLCLFLGKISYPLYMTHYAFLWMFGNYYISHKPATMQLTLIIVGGIILTFGASWLVMIFYDIPVRKYLSDKRIERL
jgi:peptidoglycan/LPS O-acetylase OafA/YrhL